MSEITFTVSPCEESGVFVASWEDPDGGGITTQGASVEEVGTAVRDAVACHFDDDKMPARIRLHFAGDVMLVTA